MSRIAIRASSIAVIVLCFALVAASPARADEVTDWNRFMFQAAKGAATSALTMSRVAAIVQASVFDAVNGIERRYDPVHVAADAPRGASQRAAAVQAAYAALAHVYATPANYATPAVYAANSAAVLAALAAQRDDSLAAISSGDAVETSQSISRGIAWGQSVADAIWAWRSTDGFAPPPPPFVGFMVDGKWRPTLPAFASGAGPQFAYMTPWVIPTPSSFRPAGPPALGSLQYLADLNETKTVGQLVSASRTDDQRNSAWFWASATSSYFWNGAAVRVAAERHTTLSENARLLALLNVAVADAAIACWESKYHEVFWRPITAIGVSDPSWRPLLPTPAHPEYPSGHSTASGAAVTVLAAFFGDEASFFVDSDGANQSAAGPGAPPQAGVRRAFTSFTEALEDVKNSRIFGGIHFRTACNDGHATGKAVAEYVAAHAFGPVHGNTTGQVGK